MTHYNGEPSFFSQTKDTARAAGRFALRFFLGIGPGNPDASASATYAEEHADSIVDTLQAWDSITDLNPEQEEMLRISSETAFANDVLVTIKNL